MNHLQILHFCLSLIENETDKEKFEALYKTYIKLMHYKARTILKQEQSAEDAVSVALLSLAKNIHMVDSVSSERTKHYVMTITQRSALNLLKKQKREEARLVTLEEAEQVAEEIQTDEENTLTAAILNLPSPYKEVIMLKFADGYHNREIAVILNLTVSNVEKIVSRGKKKLQKELSKGVYL